MAAVNESRPVLKTRLIWIYRYLRIPAISYVQRGRKWSSWVGQFIPNGILSATGDEYRVTPYEFNVYKKNDDDDDESIFLSPYYDITTEIKEIPPNHLIWSRTKDLAFQYYYNYELKGLKPEPIEIDAKCGYVSFYLGLRLKIPINEPYQKWYLLRSSWYLKEFQYKCHLFDLYLGDTLYKIPNCFPPLDYDSKNPNHKDITPWERFIQYVQEYKKEQAVIKQLSNEQLFEIPEQQLKEKIMSGNDKEAKRYFYVTHPSYKTTR